MGDGEHVDMSHKCTYNMQSICVVDTMNQHLKVVVLLLKLYSLFIVAPIVGVLCLFHVLLGCALCPF